jgi:hypothetical protein
MKYKFVREDLEGTLTKLSESLIGRKKNQVKVSRKGERKFGQD